MSCEDLWCVWDVIEIDNVVKVVKCCSEFEVVFFFDMLGWLRLDNFIDDVCVVVVEEFWFYVGLV